MRQSVRFFPVFLLLAFSALPAFAQSASIHGVVTDPSGSVIRGADVALLDSLIAVGNVRTDAQGDYRFEGLKEGTYTVVGNSPGLTSISQEIAVHGGDDQAVNLQLKLSAVQQRVVVSASLGGALAPQTGSSVTVIDHHEIESEGMDQVADTMRNVPGVEINQTGQMGAVSSAFIRGGSSDYNLVMVDGIPLNDFGGGFDLSTLPTQGVDRVEVLRGPQSALYGSNAVSGVINVVTQSGDGSPRFNFEGEGGSNDLWMLATGGSGSAHGFGWAYDLSKVSTQGVRPYDEFWNQSSFLSLSYSRSPRRSFVVHFFGNTSHDQNPGPFGSDPYGFYEPGADSASLQKRNMFGYQAGYTERISGRVRQVSSVSVSTDRFEFPSSFGNSFTNNLRLAANTRSEITLSDRDVLVAGFEYDRETYEDTYVAYPDLTPFVLPRNSYAVFAENRWSAGDRLFLSTGVRVDSIHTGDLPADESDAGRPFIPASSVTQVNPRVSVAYLARGDQSGFSGATRIHSSFGTGIRPPDGFELGFTDNPQLKPERSISGDAGVEQRFWSDKASLDVTYFYSRFSDQIVVLGGSFANLSTFTSANVANSRAYGIETSLSLRPWRSVEARAEYTWLNTAILALNGSTGVQLPFQVGDPFLRQPRSSAGYDVTWTHGRLMLNSNASIRGAVLDLEPNLGSYTCTGLHLQCLFRNPGYVDANAGFAYRLPLGASIFGRLNNFTNDKYEESFGYPALHLNFVAGLRLDFPAASQ